MNFKTFEEFSPELQEIWQNFYSKTGKIYCTSYEWCYTWFKYFGEGKKPFIITGWQEDNIKFLAPFYKKANKLYGIGSNPDFYDNFCVITDQPGCLINLANFIVENNIEIDLRLISSRCEFYKYLLRRFEQENIYKIKIYHYTVKPLLYSTDEFKNSLNKKYKNLKRKQSLAKRDFNDELQYDYKPDKKEEYIEEFMNFHMKKWNTFKTPANRNFIRDLYLNNDFVVLARLYLKNTEKSVAYNFKYKSPNNILYENMFSYNEKYSALSPGFLVMYHDIKAELNSSVNYINYGAGSYSYKYYFANKDEIALNIKAELCWKRHKKIYSFLKNIQTKINP